MATELVQVIVQAIDACGGLANNTLKAYRSYRNADVEIGEKFILLEALWTRLEVQLQALGKIADKLDDKLADSQFRLLQVLQGKLLHAASSMQMPDSKLERRLRYTRVKARLDELVKELEAWQSRFDPTWYLVIRMNDQSVDSVLWTQTENEPTRRSAMNPVSRVLALRQADQAEASSLPHHDQPQFDFRINMSEKELQNGQTQTIPLSEAWGILRHGSTTWLIAETIKVPSANQGMVKTDVQSLAKRLKHIDAATFGLLCCRGTVKRREHSTGHLCIDMIYEAPAPHHLPNSLRQLLLHQNAVSASAIVRTAKRLVQSVSYIHSCNFVHKNIRPENILVSSGGTSPLGLSFLVGFSSFRTAYFQTGLAGDTAWERNLYRHPERQGANIISSYCMQHDIYSLGVCLLEIGLWQSFVMCSEHTAATPSHALGITISDRDFETNGQQNGRVKDHLVRLAQERLPPKLGDIYTDIVVLCLTCLDPGNALFGNDRDPEDNDPVSIGIEFIENILHRIADISI